MFYENEPIINEATIANHLSDDAAGRVSRLFPLVTFDEITLDEANKCLIKWMHVMGPLNRPMGGSVVNGGG